MNFNKLEENIRRIRGLGPLVWSVICCLQLMSVLVATDNSIGVDSDWDTGSNWSLGHFPDGVESANILAGVTIGGDSTLSTNNYTGNLILNEGAFLNLNGGSDNLEDHLPSDNSSIIFMYDGSKIYYIDGNIYDIYNPFVIRGAVTIHQRYSSDTKTFYGKISGNGSIKFNVSAWGNPEESYLSPAVPNTYTGGTTIISERNEFHITSNGALGTGDVKIGGTSGDAGSVKFTGTTDVIDDGAELWMEDRGILNLGGGTETVRLLLFDGVVQNPTGYPETWGSSSSGANQTNDAYFTGTGILTVTGGADTSPPSPNPMKFTELPSGNSTTSISMTAITAVDQSAVEYFFENISASTNSGWQSGTFWCEEGLTPSTNYLYRVKARNSDGAETGWSDLASSAPSYYNTLISAGNTWNTASAWSLGQVPSGNQTVVISAGNSVTSNTTPTSSYAGGMIIEEGGSLVLTDGSSDIQDYVPSESSGRIVIKDGGMIQMYQLGGATLENSIQIYGDVTFKNTNPSNELYLNGLISGNGTFNAVIDASSGTSSLHFDGDVPNTYTGGTNILSEAPGGNEDEFYVDSDGALGTGNVTINNGVRLEFGGSTTDAIDDTADLYLNGSVMVDLNSNTERVNRLYIDGVLQESGTWGSSTSGARHVSNTYFEGTGMLLVAYNTSAEDNYIAADVEWSSPASWSQLHVPIGTESANILANTTVTGSSYMPQDYTGNLILNKGATLLLNGNFKLEDHLPSDNSSTVFMYEGSKIYIQDTNIFDVYNPIQLRGQGTIQTHYNSDKKTFYGPISGNGSLKFDMNAWGNTEESYLSPPVPNTYVGGTEIISRKNEFHITTNGALGPGDVKIGGTSGDAGSVKFTGTTDVIDDDAELWMEEYGILNLGGGAETVRLLLFDGVIQNPTGYPETWGSSSSGANQTNDTYFTGAGVLTVTGNVDATAPWPNPMTFSLTPAGNSLTSIGMTATTATDISAIEYYFENITTADNSGWQTATYWCNEGLTASTNYSFRVKARNAQGVETEWSDISSSITSVYNYLISDGASWNTAGAWSLGHVPKDTETVVITAGNSVTSNTTPNDFYTGDLIIEAGGSLVLTNGSSDIEDYVPSGSTGSIRLYEGALIQLYQLGDSTTTLSHSIVLYGDATLKNTHYNTTLYLTGLISGSGQLNFIIDASYQTPSLHLAGSVPNTYTGGTNLTAESLGGNADELYVDEDGCLGPGDVTVNDGTFLDFGGTTTDVIDDGAILFLNDTGSIDLNANSETVRMLSIDGVIQQKGTYGSTTSGADNQNDAYFSGAGVLTVLEGPPDGTVFRIK